MPHGIELIVHLPGIALQCDGADLGAGKVTVLSFDEWQQLDPGFDDEDRKYARSKPAFWIGPLPGSERADAEQLVRHAQAAIWSIHAAFLLGEGVPWLPTPSLSANYLRASADDVVQTLRIVGPAEREWILHGSPLSVPYDQDRLAAVAREYRLIERHGLADARGGVRGAMSTLETTARPDSWWGAGSYHQAVHDFLHCIAACEAMLLPKVDNKTEAFGTRAAALTAPHHAQIRAEAAAWSDTYRLRNRLVHGRLGIRQLDASQRALLPRPRHLLRSLVRSALVLDRRDDAEAKLPPLLLSAASDAAEHAQLQRTLGQQA